MVVHFIAELGQKLLVSAFQKSRPCKYVSTLVSMLQIQTNETPLTLRRQMLTVKYITKAKTMSITTILRNLAAVKAVYFQNKKSPLLCETNYVRYSANFDTHIYKVEEKAITYFGSLKPCYLSCISALHWTTRVWLPTIQSYLIGSSDRTNHFY